MYVCNNNNKKNEYLLAYCASEVVRLTAVFTRSSSVCDVIHTCELRH